MDQQHRGRTVVVGVDGSESALRAVRWSAFEAARRGVALRIVTAFEWPHGHPVGEVGLGRSYRDIMLGESRRHLAEAAAVAERAVDGLGVEQQLVVGFPIPVLAEQARRAQLVVIGDRGLGGVTGLLLGSVATALAAHADSPVVVVRGEDPDPMAPIVVGVDGSPVSEAALAFAYEAAAARGVPLVAVHSWRRVVAPGPARGRRVAGARRVHRVAAGVSESCAAASRALPRRGRPPRHRTGGLTCRRSRSDGQSGPGYPVEVPRSAPSWALSHRWWSDSS